MNNQLDLFGPPAQGQAAFDEWKHTAHGREVCKNFIAKAYVLKKRGYDHYGARALVEVIRWETAMKHGPDEDGFKINNNFTPYLARHAEAREPSLKGFFLKRTLKDEQS